MYLLAACALSYKILFRMLAKALHLDSLLTHPRELTTRYGGKSTIKSNITHTIYLGPMHPAHEGFDKMHAGVDDDESWKYDDTIKDVEAGLPLYTGIGKTAERESRSDSNRDLDFHCKGHRNTLD
jgi:hypothetical protein